MTYRPQAIDIEVTDDGIWPCGAPIDGHGLRGLRERAALLGGSFSAGPAKDGGFRIWATLPAAELPIATAPAVAEPS